MEWLLLKVINQLIGDEVESLRSHFAAANISEKSKSNLYIFTEQGIYMLMTVLKGELTYPEIFQRCRLSYLWCGWGIKES